MTGQTRAGATGALLAEDEPRVLTACPGIPACPLYVSSHVAFVGGCMDGNLREPCRVARGDIDYCTAYEQACDSALALGRKTTSSARKP